MIVFLVIAVNGSWKDVESVWDSQSAAETAITEYRKRVGGVGRTQHYIITRDLNTLRKSVLEQG